MIKLPERVAFVEMTFFIRPSFSLPARRASVQQQRWGGVSLAKLLKQAAGAPRPRPLLGVAAVKRLISQIVAELLA